MTGRHHTTHQPADALPDVDVLEPVESRWQPYPEYKDSGVEWLSDIPAHWNTASFKYIARLNYGDSLPSDHRADGGIEVFGSNGSVGFHSHPNTMQPVTIIGRKGSYGKLNFSWDAVFAIDTTFFIDESTSKADLRWLYYAMQLLKLDTFSEDSAVPGLSRDFVYSQRLPVLSQDEQRAIAAFLDRETTKIDALIAKKQRLIDLLQEQRSALISHAVTKGLDPSVPMRDSGIAWLGEIPAHWSVKRVKHVTRIFRGKFTHRPRNDPRLYDGQYPFIQTGDVANAGKYITEYQQTLNKEGLAVSQLFPAGTLVMTIAANIGDLAILSFPACFPDSIVGFAPSEITALNFLYHSLTSLKADMEHAAVQNTQLNLNVERIGNRQMAVPPLSEQKEIAQYLDEQVETNGRLIGKIDQAIQKLTEYRTALISAAVTGKIDVRGEVKPGEEIA